MSHGVNQIVESDTFYPNVPARSNGEDQEETYEQEGLEVVGRDAFCGEDHGSDELALRSTKARAENNAQAAIIWSLDWCGKFAYKASI